MPTCVSMRHLGAGDPLKKRDGEYYYHRSYFFNEVLSNYFGLGPSPELRAPNRNKQLPMVR